MTARVNFSDYIMQRGVHFPTTVLHATYHEGREAYIKWNFRNVLFDRIENESDYEVELAPLSKSSASPTTGE